MGEDGGLKRGGGSDAKGRLTGLRRLMKGARLDGLMVTCMENVRYLTGFTGSAGSVVVAPRRAYFLTDGRYTTQAREQVNGYTVRQYKAPLKDVAALVSSLSITRLGVEAEHISQASYRAFRGAVEVHTVRSTGGLVEELRMVKDGGEIDALRGAVGLVEKSLEDVMGSIRPGTTEWEVAVELEHRFKLSGSEKNSFDFIVASGKRGALPHGIATDKKVRKGEMVTIDCGGRWKGYYSDCTRTCVVGKPTGRQREIYQIVLEAQQKAIEAVRPGVKAEEVDAAAREHISAQGYGKYYTHSTGHGVGLSVHEEPRVAQGNTHRLMQGMVITVEPGIYIPDWGGVRIEDMILVTRQGAKVLTKGVTKDFLIV